MQGQQNQSDQSKMLTMSQAVNIIFLVCHIWCLPVILLVRRRFGSRYIDGWLLAAAVWPMIFCAFVAPNFSIAWAISAFWIILLLAVFHRIYGFVGDPHRQLRHSQFAGESWLCSWFPSKPAHAIQRYEAMLMMLLAALSAIVSPSMFLFGWGAIFAHVIKEGLIAFYRQTELADLRDARIEQEALANRMRNRHF